MRSRIGHVVSGILRARRVGIDLDNTIVDYTESFARGVSALGFAVERAGGKSGLRDALRAGPNGERAWQRLQAFAYGDGMAYARPFPGVERFVAEAVKRGVEVTIVSHKTQFAAARPDVDLRAAASGWLAQNTVLGRLPVLYADSRAEKLALIERTAVPIFIDDLPEVFADPAFPAGVQRWLFAPAGTAGAPDVDRVVHDWDVLADEFAAR